MDYDSMQDKAYNTKLDHNLTENDLQDIEPKAYQKSENPVKDKISIKKSKEKSKVEKREKSEKKDEVKPLSEKALSR